jgi:hypothetical protein
MVSFARRIGFGGRWREGIEFLQTFVAVEAEGLPLDQEAPAAEAQAAEGFIVGFQVSSLPLGGPLPPEVPGLPPRLFEKVRHPGEGGGPLLEERPFDGQRFEGASGPHGRSPHVLKFKRRYPPAVAKSTVGAQAARAGSSHVMTPTEVKTAERV